MKKYNVIAITIGITAMLTACGKAPDELNTYYDNMSSFISELDGIKSEMNTIDTSSDTANTEFLGYLTEMNTAFEEMAEYEVPSQFSANETLADEASSYMSEALDLFTEYYNDPEADSSVYEAATENYNRAFLRVSYISSILQGETPEGDNLSITEEDSPDFTPVTEEDETAY